LDVTPDRLLDAALECWRSAYSPRASAYQTRLALDHTAPIAVLVQVMVPAEFAGILFTRDPLRDEATQMPVEVTPGRGDQIASGTMLPLRATLQRRTGKASLDVRAIPDPASRLPLLDWRQLIALAERIESLFQSPQDIEWAYAQGTFWILQSRPITTRHTTLRRQIWTRANAGEILPGVVTPLTWSVFKPILQAAGQHRAWSPLTLHWRWKLPSGFPDSPRLFRGRAYMELASVFASLGGLPGVDAEILHRLLGFEFQLCAPDELPIKLPRWHVMDPYRTIRFWLEMLGVTRTLTGAARRWLKTTNDLVCDGEIPSARCLDAIKRLWDQAAQILGLHLQCTCFAFSAFGLIDQTIRRYAEPEAVQNFQAGLIADFQNISTVQQGVAIWNLAQVARRTLAISRALFAHKSAADVIADWRASGDQEFLSQWDAFVARFGDRSTQEFELAIPHWDQDPTFVLQTMREIIEHKHPDPHARLIQQKANEDAHLARTLAQVEAKSARAAWLLRRLCAVYRTWVPLRENLKYALIVRFNRLRKEFLALGKYLADEHIIVAECDVMFLRYEEIRAAVEHPAATDYRALVAVRRAEYAENTRTPAPDVWIVTDGRETPMTLPTWRDSEVLQGIGCSPGIVTAMACVLDSVEGDLTVLPGQIIVAPSIDPGLTPLFLHAAGLVTEIGGMLSHGATVAREFGLPAVVAVPHATRLIQNGQSLTVDGFTGRVYLQTQECIE
jgi:pyruvate,water dikinase